MEQSNILKPSATPLLILNKIASISGLGFSVIAFLLSSMVFGVIIPVMRMSSLSATINEVFLYSFLAALAVILIQILSTVLYAQGTALEKKSSSIELQIGGFRKTTLSIPITQLQNILVHQSLLERMLGIATIQISQFSGFISVWGLPYTQAQTFVQLVQQ